MHNFDDESIARIEDDLSDQNDLSLKSYFKSNLSPDDVSALAPLRRAQSMLQAFTALFHGGINSVLMRLLVLRELASDVETPALSRADINAKLGYLEPEALETVLTRLRSTGLMVWDQSQSVYRITPMARNALSAIESLVQVEQQDDQAEMSYMLTQVAGAQAVGGVSVEQLHHLLGRLIELTEEFADAIASGSEFQLRAAQQKWHTACDWVEKGSQIIHAITNDSRADSATHRAAQAIGRAQSALLNMQGMFSRALNQIERQRVHLGQSGLSTTDIKMWLLQRDDLASLADGALSHPVTPHFITPSEMIDVAESELLANRGSAVLGVLPSGQDAPSIANDTSEALLELDHWLDLLSNIDANSIGADNKKGKPLQEVLLPASFAIASYRASLLPLIGDANEASLQGATAMLARLPLEFQTKDRMQKMSDPHVAAISIASLIPAASSAENKAEEGKAATNEQAESAQAARAEQEQAQQEQTPTEEKTHD